MDSKKLRNYSEVSETKPVVEEVISPYQAQDLGIATYRDSRNPGYPIVSAQMDVVYVATDGSNHEGTLVTLEHEDGSKNNFFMEVTFGEWTVEFPNRVGHAIWHKWIADAPMSDRSEDICLDNTKYRRSLDRDNVRWNIQDFVSDVVDENLTKSLVFPKDVVQFTYNYGDYYETFRDEQMYSEFEVYRKEALEKLKTGEVPANDQLWEDLCIGILEDDQSEVFYELRKKGHDVRLDGERDSFGWVSLGIIMDDELMCGYF